MLTREDCLARAMDCEELAAGARSYGGGDAMMQAAAMWRRLAERAPSFKRARSFQATLLGSGIVRSDEPLPQRRAA